MHDPTVAATGTVASDPGASAPQATPGHVDGKRHWWSPAPAPELSPVTAKRAYGEVLFVFSAFFLAGVIAAGLLLADRYKNLLNNGSWAQYTPRAVDILLQSAVAVTLVVLLSARRGVSGADLGLRWPRRPDGRFAAGATTRILAWAMFALIAGAIVNALLQTGHLPTSKPSAAELVYGVVASVQAGVVEEVVVLAFVVVTLRQARRPLWEVTVVALILRGSYHIYYGPGVVGILLWAALFYWIYLRTRSLLPLMVTHAAWDAVGFLSQRWGWIVLIGVLVVVALWIAAPITWAVEKGDRDRESRLVFAGGAWAPAGPAGRVPVPVGNWIPPGWHPDPSGVHYWRWWDGYRWTDHVSGP